MSDPDEKPEPEPQPEPEPEPGPGDASVAEDRIARARARRLARVASDDDVPRLPRGRGFRIARGAWFKVGATAAALVILVVVAKPCANAVSTFVTGFGDPGSASEQMPRPGNVERAGSQHFEVLRPDMTEEELKAAIERARAANRREHGEPPPPASSAGSGSAGTGSAGSAGAGSGSAGGGSAGSGSATRGSATSGSATSGSAIDPR